MSSRSRRRATHKRFRVAVDRGNPQLASQFSGKPIRSLERAFNQLKDNRRDLSMTTSETKVWGTALGEPIEATVVEASDGSLSVQFSASADAPMQRHAASLGLADLTNQSTTRRIADMSETDRLEKVLSDYHEAQKLGAVSFAEPSFKVGDKVSFTYGALRPAGAVAASGQRWRPGERSRHYRGD